jgi:FixJ family two-component response regulator
MNAAHSLVLVLDDDPAAVLSLSRLLTAHGHEVRGYQRADDFFNAGFPPLPACLLLDQHLGAVKGTDVHAEMKRRGWELPIIFLTADWDTRTVVRAMQGGAVDYLVKPFDPDELVALVWRAIQRSSESEAAARKLEETRRRAGTLTERERAVVHMVAAGLLNKEISDRLGLALITVKVTRSKAMMKLGAKNTADLVRIAALAGISPSN